jgi:hypothetical protein
MKKLLMIINLVLLGYMAFSQIIQPNNPPKFPECICKGYEVSVGVEGGKINTITNGTSITLQQGENLAVKANLICVPPHNSPNTPCCKTEAWELIDVTTGTPVVVINWSYAGFPEVIDTKNLKCDRKYELVLKGRCGCNECETFIIPFTIKCDCCQNLPEPVLQTNTPKWFCLEKPCEQIYNFYTNQYKDCPDVKFIWSVKDASGASVAFTGQGSNAISINCAELKAGDYTVSLTVRCKDKSYTTNYTFTVCAKPNPNFIMESDASTATFTSTAGCTDYWYLVTDNDNSCNYSVGDTYVYQTGSSVTFGSLVPNQQYTIYHFIWCKCGENSNGCWSSRVMCFKWLPPSMKTSPGSNQKSSQIGKISEMELKTALEIPAQFKKELPKEIHQARKLDLQQKN